MGWHHWEHEDEEGNVEMTYVYVPTEQQDISEEWPEIDCGPEYWMWKIAADFNAEMDKRRVG